MPETQSYFMGLDGFVWFVGVVEDRNDPDQLGRVRVRCLGFHTENLTDLPTADLPWAHVMHPTTDPSMHGMGNSPSFLVEGGWVVGFFRDAAEKQQPIIIGTLPGVPKSSADPTKGFNDPRHQDSTQLNDGGLKQYAKQTEKDGTTSNPDYGTYPLGASKDLPPLADSGSFGRTSGHTFGESDTSRLARGETSETHGALVTRRSLKQTDIPIAIKPVLNKIHDTNEAAETRGTWDEPNPKGVESDADPYASATYPYNHVYESEAGHIFEIDDTPGGERLNREHSSGTFEEIHPLGDKVVKVIGDNYEIIAGISNVVIGTVLPPQLGEQGDVLNLTINGNVRELIRGDYIQEIEGNFTQKIGQNHRIKVGAGGQGNLEEEILGNHGYNINEAVKGRIGADIDVLIGANELRTVNGKSKLVTGKNYELDILDNMTVGVKDDLKISTASGIVSVSSANKMVINSAQRMTLESEADIDMDSATTTAITAGTDIDMDSGGLTDITAGTIVDINSGGGLPSGINVINLN